MPSELTRSVSHTSDDIETCTTGEIAMQDFFNLFHCGLSWHPQRPKKGIPLGQVVHHKRATSPRAKARG